MLVVSTPEVVDHWRSWLVFLTGSLSDFSFVRIDSLVPESTSDLTSWVLECLSFLPSGMTSSTKIIGLKCMCYSFSLGLVCLYLLVSFCIVFYRWAPCNVLSKLLELSVCSFIFDLLLGSNLLMINPYLKPLSKMFTLLTNELLLFFSLSAYSES